MRILIADTDHYLCRSMKAIFRMNHFDVDTCDDGESTLELAMSSVYDCIVLGMVSTRLNAFAVVRKLRQAGDRTPVLMLTSHDNYKERVKGLESGADYCLSKPFQTAELMACIRALTIRRYSPKAGDCIGFGDLKLNLSTCELMGNEGSIILSQKEFGIMEMLFKAGNQFVSKEQIRLHVWGFDSDITDNNVEAHISLLRKHCKDVHSSVRIISRRLSGYRLVSVQQETCEEQP